MSEKEYEGFEGFKKEEWYKVDSIDAVGKETKNEIVAMPNRHPLLKGKDLPYVQKHVEEMQLDDELGLLKQKIITKRSLVMKDIDELTSDADYKEINDNVLNKMFGIDGLKKKSVSYNFTSYVKCFGHSYWPALTLSSLIITGILLVTLLLSVKSFVGAGIFGAIIFLGCVVMGKIVGGHTPDSKYNKIKVFLHKEDVESTEMKIPYGAKLKLSKASKSKIFSSFRIAHPKIAFEENSMTQHKMDAVDPAILGVSVDGREYLICWWDIEKDVDRVEDTIDWVKKYKV